MNTLRKIFLGTVAAVFLFACSPSVEVSEEESSDLIEITREQFTTDSMRLGEIESRHFENTIECNGSIVPLPEGMAKVNALVQGLVKNIFVRDGQYVAKNQAILEIGGSEVIDIQNAYAEAAANFRRSQSAYQRLKALHDTKVSSEKDFIEAETEYHTALARYNGLKLKMEAIGFSGKSIENGEIHSYYAIKAPISGYVSNLSAHIGSYIDPQSNLLEIINPEMLQLKLSVFPEDIDALEKGQKVRFRYADNQGMHLATLSSIGVAIDDATKSIECYASLQNMSEDKPIAQRFIRAEIITRMDTVSAIPSSAIGKNEQGHFILVLREQQDERYLFENREVQIGREYDGYTEVVEPRVEGRLLTKGIYNIL